MQVINQKLETENNIEQRGKLQRKKDDVLVVENKEAEEDDDDGKVVRLTVKKEELDETLAWMADKVTNQLRWITLNHYFGYSSATHHHPSQSST